MGDETLFIEAKQYLDDMREAGHYEIVDMLLSIQMVFLLADWEAKQILFEWIQEYGDRN